MFLGNVQISRTFQAGSFLNENSADSKNPDPKSASPSRRTHRPLSPLPTVLALIFAVSPGLSAWTPGTGSPAAADGFVVDTMDRTDVLAFYNTVYTASQNFTANMAWTGSVLGGVAGTTSADFKEDVRRRVNFYRAMSGLPADITFDATKSAKCQEAALMFAATGQLSHFPKVEQGWFFFTENSAEAAAHSNLALGNYGPGAVDAYMRDDGDGNQVVGHRRWINYPRAQFMGTGDVPAQSLFYSANALWVIGDSKPPQTPKFVAWPNRGFVPFNLVPARWSLSYPGANFAGASVTMMQGGVPVPTTIISNAAYNMGDNTLVWTPSGLPTSVAADTPYQVTVSGISGTNIPTSYSYTVTLFDPNVLDTSAIIAGSDSPPTTGSAYTFNSIAQADAYELRVTTAIAAAWNEGAEDPGSFFQPITGGAFRQPAVVHSGGNAFQLVFPDFTDQSFVINRDVIPSATSYLQFYDLGRFATTTSTLHAEVSTNNGATWTPVWGRYGVGLDSSYWDPYFIGRSVSLAAFAGQIVKIRFIIRWNGQPITNGTSEYFGFFIDDVTITDSVELGNETTTALPGTATSFSLDSLTAGAPLTAGTAYYLRVRPNVGTRWFAYGAPKIVTARIPNGYESWLGAQYPIVTGGATDDHDHDGLTNGVEYAFGLNPTAATPGLMLPQPAIVGNNYTISFPRPPGVTDVNYGVQWSPDLVTWTPVTDTGSGGNQTFSVSKVGKDRLYFRHQIVVGP